MSLSPYDCEDTQAEIAMTEKRDNNSVASGQQLQMTGPSKSIIEPQKVGPISLEILEDQVEKRSILPDRKVLIYIWLQVHIAHYIALHPLYCLAF